MNTRWQPRRSGGPRRRALGAVAAMASLMVLGPSGMPTSELQRRLSEAGLMDRVSQGRTSLQHAWQPCRHDGAQARGRCASSPANAATLAHAVRFTIEPTSGNDGASDVDQAHYRALVDLRFDDGRGDGATRAVETLTRLVRRSERAAYLNDLAVAHLLRADMRGDLTEYLTALDVARRALELEPEFEPARFNHALLLERLELRQSARRAWKGIVLDARSEDWSAEAAARLREMPAPESGTVPWASIAVAGAPPVSTALLRELTARSPQQAREFGLGLLALWGRHTMAGAADSARRTLDVAAGIGDALVGLGGDAGLRRTVAAVRRLPAEQVAGPFASLKAGITLLENGAYDEGKLVLRPAMLALRRGRVPMWRWAAFYAGFGEINSNNFDEAEVILRRALTDVPADEPALEGKLIWALGVNELRRGRYDAAVQHYQRARPRLQQSKEGANIGGISYLLTEALELSGRSVEASREALTGLHLLASHSRAGYLNDHLSRIAAIARKLNLRHAALAITGEVVENAIVTDRPQDVAWAFRDRARDHLALQDPVAARADVDSAFLAQSRMRPGSGSERVRADVELVLAGMLSRAAPDSASALFRHVIDSYRYLNLVNYVPRALAEAAEHELSARDTAAAAEYLADGVRLVENLSGGFASGQVRATFASTVDPLYDHAIELALASHDTLAALDLLKRAQLAPWQDMITAREAPRGARASLDGALAALGPSEAVIAYAVLRTQLMVWVGTQAGWRAVAQPIGRDRLAGLVHAGVEALRGSREESDSALTALHALLIEPVRAALTGIDKLVVIPDYSLGFVPFAALRNGRSGRYLVQDMEIRHLPSLALLRPVRTAARNGRRAFIIGNASAQQDLPPLPAATAEAQRVTKSYAHATLSDGSVTVPQIAAQLQRNSVFHFAGHAVSNLEQPDLSFLVVNGTTRLVARDIAALDLRALDVAVLSACRTQGAAQQRGGVASGLAFSFLLAGTRATVSSLWDVSDASARDLQFGMHALLARGIAPATALRQAQQTLLAGSDPRMRHPMAWAAFVVSGQ